MTRSEIMNRLQAIIPDLGEHMARAANYLVEHPDDVAVYSMRELARNAGVPPVTFVRLAKRLGLPGYGVLREKYVHALLDEKNGRPEAYTRNTEAARVIMASAAAGESSLAFAEAFFIAEQEILKRSFSGLSEERLNGAATLLATANNIFIIGRRTSFSPAFTMAYSLRKARPGVRFLNDSSGAPEGALEDIAEGDAFVAFTFSPFSRVTDSLARRAASANAKLIVISDSLAAPIRDLANKLFFTAPTVGRSFPESSAGAMAIANLLTALTVAKLGKSAEARIMKNERFLVNDGEYVLAGRRSRRRSTNQKSKAQTT